MKHAVDQRGNNIREDTINFQCNLTNVNEAKDVLREKKNESINNDKKKPECQKNDRKRNNFNERLHKKIEDPDKKTNADVSPNSPGNNKRRQNHIGNICTNSINGDMRERLS